MSMAFQKSFLGLVVPDPCSCTTSFQGLKLVRLRLNVSALYETRGVYWVFGDIYGGGGGVVQAFRGYFESQRRLRLS